MNPLPFSSRIGRTTMLSLAMVAALAQGCFAQNFKVTLLGTGAPRPVLSRFGPSILVEAGKTKLLFDCGRGATQRLYQLKIPFNEINGLFLTHLHSDHTVGIPDLWLTGWVMGRDTHLLVWGPKGTKAMMKHLQEAYAFDIHIRRDVDTKLPGAGAMVVARDIEQGVVYDSDGVKVTAFLVDHGEIKPAFGYRIDYGGHSVTLSGDTRPSENLVRFAQGTDVLIHEVIDVPAYGNLSKSDTSEQTRKIVGHHTTAEQAGTIFTRVKARLAVYSHIVPPDVPDVIPHTRKTYSGPLEVGEDLMSIEIGDKIIVHRPAP
ncbi:MAG: MBL fold metallo-hydrolase [Terriglobales bacterium]